MQAKIKDLWVLIETGRDGRAKNVSLELLNPGRRLADGQQGKLVAVVIGSQAGEAVRTVQAYRADQIIVMDGPEFARYTTDAYTDALHALVEKYGPATLPIGAIDSGRDMAPRLSCRLKMGLTADCTALDIDEQSDSVAWTHPAFDGNLMATILCPGHRPQIDAIYPGVFEKEEPNDSRSTEVIKEDVHIPEKHLRTKVLDVINGPSKELVDLEGAGIIVSGGCGVGGPEGFRTIRELADALGTTVGASRAIVNSGQISRSCQVGQSGETIDPKFYITAGILGTIQHLAGMSSSGVAIAINKDPDAPIFGVADYGMVGDLFRVLPALTKSVKERKGFS